MHDAIYIILHCYKEIKTFIISQNISVSNKCCSFKLSNLIKKNPENKNNVSQKYEAAQLFQHWL